MKRTQTPGNGMLSTVMPSAEPIQATHQLMLQHLHAANYSALHPTSQYLHPTAVINDTTSILASSPCVGPSTAMHAMAVASSNASSSSSLGPPAQLAMQQPQQGQPQVQPQVQVLQAHPTFAQQVEGFRPPSQAYMNMAANLNPVLDKHLVVQGRLQLQQQLMEVALAQAVAQKMTLHMQMQLQQMHTAGTQAQVHAAGGRVL